MIVHLLGNVAAGKTTLLRQATQHLSPNVQIVLIDDLYKMGYFTSADLWGLIDRLERSDERVIFEHTGRSQGAIAHFQKYPKTTRILLDTPVSTCYSRWISREKNPSEDFKQHTRKQLDGLHFYLQELSVDHVICVSPHDASPIDLFLKCLPVDYLKRIH